MKNQSYDALAWGLASKIDSANPVDFTPYAWNRAKAQADWLKQQPDKVRHREKAPLHIRDAAVEMRILLNQGAKINRW